MILGKNNNIEDGNKSNGGAIHDAVGNIFKTITYFLTFKFIHE